jgi:hypothetical protein
MVLKDKVFGPVRTTDPIETRWLTCYSDQMASARVCKFKLKAYHIFHVSQLYEDVYHQYNNQ